jgi:hypothetical protein
VADPEEHFGRNHPLSLILTHIVEIQQFSNIHQIAGDNIDLFSLDLRSSVNGCRKLNRGLPSILGTTECLSHQLGSGSNISLENNAPSRQRKGKAEEPGMNVIDGSKLVEQVADDHFTTIEMGMTELSLSRPFVNVIADCKERLTRDTVQRFKQTTPVTLPNNGIVIPGELDTDAKESVHTGQMKHTLVNGRITLVQFLN